MGPLTASRGAWSIWGTLVGGRAESVARRETP